MCAHSERFRICKIGIESYKKSPSSFWQTSEIFWASSSTFFASGSSCSTSSSSINSSISLVSAAIFESLSLPAKSIGLNRASSFRTERKKRKRVAFTWLSPSAHEEANAFFAAFISSVQSRGPSSIKFWLTSALCFWHDGQEQFHCPKGFPCERAAQEITRAVSSAVVSFPQHSPPENKIARGSLPDFMSRSKRGTAF